jgi:CBS domain-containing protein
MLNYTIEVYKDVDLGKLAADLLLAGLPIASLRRVDNLLHVQLTDGLTQEQKNLAMGILDEHDANLTTPPPTTDQKLSTLIELIRVMDKTRIEALPLTDAQREELISVGLLD